MFSRFFNRLMQSFRLIQNAETLLDIEAFFKDHVWKSAIESIYGPAILESNLGLLKNLWQFDVDVIWFSKWLPRWLIPDAYANRSRLRSYTRRWQEYARNNSQQPEIYNDGDGEEPIIGSRFSL